MSRARWRRSAPYTEKKRPEAGSRSGSGPSSTYGTRSSIARPPGAPLDPGQASCRSDLPHSSGLPIAQPSGGSDVRFGSRPAEQADSHRLSHWHAFSLVSSVVLGSAPVAYGRCVSLRMAPRVSTPSGPPFTATVGLFYIYRCLRLPQLAPMLVQQLPKHLSD